MRLVRLCNDQKTACVLVYPVDDPGTFDAVYPGKSSPHLIKERRDESPLIISGRGMDHHALRFVYDGKHIVLVNDAHRYILRQGVGRLQLRHIEREHIAGCDAHVLLRRFPAKSQHAVLYILRGGASCYSE